MQQPGDLFGELLCSAGHPVTLSLQLVATQPMHPHVGSAHLCSREAISKKHDLRNEPKVRRHYGDLQPTPGVSEGLCMPLS